MTKVYRYSRLLLTVAFAATACYFFGVLYPAHLHYMEQNQLFLFTAEYWEEVAAVPGGVADYLGSFFTQFNYHTWVGAGIWALTLTGVQCLTVGSLSRKEGIFFPLSFLPAFFLWAFLADEHAMPGAIVSILLSMAMAALLRNVKATVARRILFLLLIPAMYLAAGSLSILFVWLSLLHEWKAGSGRERWGCAATALLLFLFCPWVAQFLVAYPLDRLLTGIHYYRFPHIVPPWPWLAVASVVLLSLLGGVKTAPLQASTRTLGMLLSALLVGLGGWKLVESCCDFSKEESMHYDYLARIGTWNRLIATANEQPPRNSMTATCLNLALAQRGLLGDYMFAYPQNGPEGLLPRFARGFNLPPVSGEAYFRLGMVNTARRYVFEAQEALPDYRKSVRCYKRLAETHLVDGNYRLAGKYIDALQHTLFYREWAAEAQTLLWNDEAVDKHPLYGHLRRIRPKQDRLFDEQQTEEMLASLFAENRENRMAFEYLMAYTLLKKELQRFYEYYPQGKRLNYDHIPRSYQEALLLIWVQHHNTLEGVPWSISPEVMQRMADFMQAFSSHPSEAAMRQRFGNTYWYYYFYRYNAQH